jgi:peroxiredoxin family protein/TusA-related sulfurtransferase
MQEQHDTISLDCRGKLCPAPILELAKLAKKQSRAAIITILATDDNFPADLEAWCRSTKNRLYQISKSADEIYTAQVALGEALAPHLVDQNTDALLPIMEDPESTNVGIELPVDTPATRIQPAPTKSSRQVEPLPIVKPVYAYESTNAARTPPNGPLIDLCGLPIEQVLLQLSSAVLQATSGSLQIISDASEFPEKVRPWAAMIGVRVLDLQREGHNTRALITRLTPDTTAMFEAIPDTQRENRASLCVMHNSFEALYVAMMMANSSTSQGIGVDIFFCFWGVALLRADKPLPKKHTSKNFLLRFFQGVIQFLTPKGPRRQKLSQLHFGGVGDQMLGYIIREKQAQTLEALLLSAVEQKVRFLVCNTSLNLLGLTKEDLMVLPNLEIAGMTAFTELARKNSFSFTF